MNKLLISNLTKIIKAHELPATSRKRQFCTGVSIDSRTIKAGDCFFAIRGENFDGHDYVSDAFAKGANCAVVSKDTESRKLADKVILKVSDTVKALGDFARVYRHRYGYKVIAITGSVGKTTLRQIIHHILSQKYRVFQSPGNFNNQIGLPMTLLGAEPQHQIVIAELGTNHPGEIAYLTNIAQPDIAIVTNIRPAHLEGLGSLKAIKKEKLSIIEGLAKKGVLIINADIAFDVPDFVSTVVTFGNADGSDFCTANITSDGSSSRFTINGTEIYLPLAGAGNIENALAAWAVCSRLDVTIDDFAKNLKTLSSIHMRAELLQIGNVTILNDCYNANPASMKNALDILTQLGKKEKRRLVFICGEMAELGNHSSQLHTDLGAAIAQAKVQLLITIGKMTKITAQNAKKSANYNLQVKCFEDTLSACNNLQELIKDNDIILVKGSRVSRLETATEKIKEIFS